MLNRLDAYINILKMLNNKYILVRIYGKNFVYKNIIANLQVMR